MPNLKKLLDNNRNWAEATTRQDPDFFTRLSELQKPEFLWIGCSDSRVPANEITGTLPGEIFVHRNIANMVVHTDLNLLSVLQYAVEHLRVKHVIVCGHYGCGGVAAALTNKSYGILNKWLRNIKDVYRIHKAEIDAQPNEKARLDRLVELNVVEQVYDLAKTSVIQYAWQDRGFPTLHGWVYRLSDGIINPLCMVDANSELDPIYRFEKFEKPSY